MRLTRIAWKGCDTWLSAEITDRLSRATKSFFSGFTSIRT